MAIVGEEEGMRHPVKLGGQNGGLAWRKGVGRGGED